jgi:hypothetical protein
LAAAAGAAAVAWKGEPGNPKGAVRRNELTIAHLRPGRDVISKAMRIYGRPAVPRTDRTSASWEDGCRQNALVVDADDSGRILGVRVTHNNQGIAGCAETGRDPWRTGRNLAVADSCGKAREIYGKPTSRSPSTRDGKPLELLYYAFDWAGPDVPQVMEVVCTAGKAGKPGQIVEITLAAPSL